MYVGVMNESFRQDAQNKQYKNYTS